MKFLIPTEPDDTHAMITKLALEQLGHEVRLMFTADLPTKQKNSVFINDDAYHWRSTDKHHVYMDNVYDVVWWRRPRKPFVPKQATHPHDHKFVVRENMLFFESIMNNLAPEAWWINRKDAAYKANSKILQLKIASQCGMKIPITLCSNDPQDIRYFLLKHENDGVIYKPFCSNCWFEEERLKISYTTKLSFLDLPENELLQLSPGIFQKEIKKKYELRIVAFGDYLVAAKLDSQSYKEGKVDWRAIPTQKLQIEPYSLPSYVSEMIRAFMKKIGLVFGVFDFIVDENYDYIFLEVNEQGQFMWMEEINPDLRILDVFLQFLLNQSRNFKWKPKKFCHDIATYSNEVTKNIHFNLKNHVELNSAQAQNQL